MQTGLCCGRGRYTDIFSTFRTVYERRSALVEEYFVRGMADTAMYLLKFSLDGRNLVEDRPWTLWTILSLKICTLVHHVTLLCMKARMLPETQEGYSVLLMVKSKQQIP